MSTAKSKYPASGPHGIKWAQIAKDAKMSALYDMLYRIISGGASHVTLNALDLHVEPNSAGSIGSLTFRPETRDLAFCLFIGVCALLHVMEALSQMFPKEEFKRRIQSYADAWAALDSHRQETCKIVERDALDGLFRIGFLRDQKLINWHAEQFAHMDHGRCTKSFCLMCALG